MLAVARQQVTECHWLCSPMASNEEVDYLY